MTQKAPELHQFNIRTHSWLYVLIFSARSAENQRTYAFTFCAGTISDIGIY